MAWAQGKGRKGKTRRAVGQCETEMEKESYKRRGMNKVRVQGKLTSACLVEDKIKEGDGKTRGQWAVGGGNNGKR